MYRPTSITDRFSASTLQEICRQADRHIREKQCDQALHAVRPVVEAFMDAAQGFRLSGPAKTALASIMTLFVTYAAHNDRLAEAIRWRLDTTDRNTFRRHQQTPTAQERRDREFLRSRRHCLTP